MTGFLPSFWGLALTTIIGSVGFHYYETVNQSLQLQWLPKDRAPIVLGRLAGVGSSTAFLAFGAIWIATLPSAPETIETPADRRRRLRARQTGFDQSTGLLGLAIREASDDAGDLLDDFPPYTLLYRPRRDAATAAARDRPPGRSIRGPTPKPLPQRRDIVLKTALLALLRASCFSAARGGRSSSSSPISCWSISSQYTLHDMVTLLIINHAVNVYLLADDGADDGAVRRTRDPDLRVRRAHLSSSSPPTRS